MTNIFDITKDIELSAKDGFEIDYKEKFISLVKGVKEIKKVYEEAS